MNKGASRFRPAPSLCSGRWSLAAASWLRKQRRRLSPLRRLLERIRELDQLGLTAGCAREAHVERRRLGLEARGKRHVARRIGNETKGHGHGGITRTRPEVRARHAGKQQGVEPIAL